MLPFRVIVVVDGERTIQTVTPLEHAPTPGETIKLPGTPPVTVRHVIASPRGNVSGVVLAWAS